MSGTFETTGPSTFYGSQSILEDLNVGGSSTLTGPVTTIDLTATNITATNLSISGSAGFGLPSGGTASRDATPTDGLIRYNTDTLKLEGYVNGEWIEIVVAIPNEQVTITSGTTAQRPSVPANGMIRYNTSLNILEGYINGLWVDLGAAGGSGAPTSAQYLTLVADATLTNERIFTPDLGLLATDGGAGLAYTVSLDINSGTWTTTTTVAGADYVVFQDVTDNSTQKRTWTNVLSDLGITTPDYLTLSTATSLTNERAFTTGLGLLATDGGAGSNYTVVLDLNTGTWTTTTTVDGADYVVFQDVTDNSTQKRTWTNIISDLNLSTLTATGMLQLNKTNATSLTDAAIWLNGASGAIMLDSSAEKRISWNDGGGNWTFRAGHYFNTSEIYVNTGDGAVEMEINSDSANGHWIVRTAPTGTSGATVSWSSNITLTNSNFTYNGDSVAVLSQPQTYTAGQIGEVTTLSDAASIAIDLSLSNNFTVTLGGNRTLANPTNATAGQSGIIFVVQDATGSRTLSYGSNYYFTGGTASAPTLTTTANAIDTLHYMVKSSTEILITEGLDWSNV